jgi:microsomal dipeptidase-like Zn-dependent dipeptidase
LAEDSDVCGCRRVSMERPALNNLPLVDSHLDLAENVTLFGRDLTLSAAEIRTLEKRTTRQATVSLPDLERGGIAVVCTTFKQGGLTPDGFALLGQMAELGFILDISHLAEEGVWQGLDLKFPRVCASHAHAQALTPTDRHLSDNVIRAVAERNGVIGLVLYNAFLEPRWKQDKSIAVTLHEHLRRHANHIAKLVG